MANSFLFVGNGSYQNRGCEAIVRGSVEILRSAFGDDSLFTSGIYAEKKVLRNQIVTETDSRISHFRLRASKPLFSGDWLADQLNRRLSMHFAGVHAPLRDRSDSIAALEIGGDNYSLDYGIPRHFLEMDKYLQSRNLPVFIWGASIGPFRDSPEFENEIQHHLMSLKGIFVRESFSAEYLHSIGVVDNVYRAADPAFLLKPTPPIDERMQRVVLERPIGVNLSPLVAKNFLPTNKMPWEITKSDLVEFINFSALFIRNLLASSDRNILLVPHVFSASPGCDDLYLLEEITRRLDLADKERVAITPQSLNAAELKWTIGKCSVFIGARTHTTIAALGSGVPTLTLGYSMKSRGLNHDLFGNQEWCIPSSALTTDILVAKCKNLLANEPYLRSHLESQIASIQKSALSAGVHLRNVINSL